MIQINKTDLKTAIQWALCPKGIWTPEIERELIIEITNLALNQHDVLKNEVAVCEDPFCVNGEIQYQSGEFVNCDKCNKQTVL